ncbi:hypothetical protein F5878DRAFT_689496 [Lentinula raphanica]|uniref:Uncharacterized protein n=1 Tax=Lentinula raphanica TaxID=153919 RepID=A0AA38P4Q3_9AGAR|nr:hypothetical protein F5880DRAFT_1665619 [Lentinula raphanica]KAJ3836288.1 hypothetical protein F5878DRAFT_689496 [Lentinula raphanica]
MSNQPIQKFTRNDGRLPSPSLPASFLEPLSPGKILEAIASEGGVAESMHSPAGPRKESRNIQALTATTTSTVGTNDNNKDKGKSKEMATPATAAIGTLTHNANVEQGTTALAATLGDISSEEPLTQPRRSGRKTSAPTIIQPITSQIATKPKCIRAAGSVDVVQGDAGGLETQEARKDIGKAKMSKGKKSKAVLPSPTSYTPTSLASASLTSAAPAPAPLASASLAQPAPLASAPLAPPASLASTFLAPASSVPVADSHPEYRPEPVLEEDDSEDGSMVGEEEALRILTAQKEALNGPISPFDAAHSDDEEQRHLAHAKVLSTAEFPPLGREPSSSELTNQKEAKKHQDENHLSTATYIPHTPSRHRRSPSVATPLENDPRNPGSDNEEEDTKNPWGTIDGRAPSIYTTPATAYGRFPWVSGLNAESFGEGQDPDQVKEWLREAKDHPDDNYMLAWYADESHLTPTQRRAIARHLIAGRTNLPKDEVRTSPPNPILRADGSVQRNTTSSVTVIAEGGKAIFLSLFPPTNNHFLALIEGLTFLNNEEEALECEAFIRRALANHSKIKQLILSKTPSVHPPIAPDAVYQDWLDSLSVTPLVIGRSGTKPDPDDIEPEEPLYDVGWRLYGRPFTESAPHQKKLQHILGSLHLSHPYMGRANFKIQPYRCGICRGVDHPIGLCPFPELNEWFGPTLQSIRENDARLRSQAGRGRGRGRGGARARGRGGRGRIN